MNNDQLTHTSGPWIACSGNAGEHFNIECKGPDNDLYPVATLKGPDRKANALLIAASPDMLEALETLQRAKEWIATSYTGPKATKEGILSFVNWAVIDVAITKAKGNATA